MPIEIRGLLEDLETYEGKNGFGANVTLSTKIDRKTKRLSLPPLESVYERKCKKSAQGLELLLPYEVKPNFNWPEINSLGEIVRLSSLSRVKAGPPLEDEAA